MFEFLSFFSAFLLSLLSIDVSSPQIITREVKIREWTFYNYSKYEKKESALLLVTNTNTYSELAEKYDLPKSYNDFSENLLLVIFFGKRNNGFDLQEERFLHNIYNVKILADKYSLKIYAELNETNPQYPNNIKLSSLVKIYKIPKKDNNLPEDLRHLFFNIRKWTYETKLGEMK